VAKLSEQTLTTIFNLQRRLVQLIDEAKATEWALFGRYGETEESMIELEQLQNGAERLRDPYLRLYRLLLAISEVQPSATAAMLELLAKTIEQSEATAEAVEASTQESKRIWNLP
jgi:hypothetical protein